MAEERYLEFDLAVERSSAGGYRARVLDSPAGTARSDFQLPFSPVELENFILRVGRTRRGVRRLESPEMEAAKNFGGQLFKAVFADEVQAALRSSLDQARAKGAGLRIRLRLVEAPELLNLPWEYLYNPTWNRFLALSVNTPLVRFIELPDRITPWRVKLPLRILVMIASPSDYPALDVEHEWQNLQQALAPLTSRGLLAIDRLESASLLALQHQLRKQEYHIFHFIGHGGFDDRAQDGVLLMLDDQGRGRPVPGQYLGALLHDEEHLRLVVLNACEGGRTGSGDPFAGSAQSLVQQGLPAVIAMQFEVTDGAAITFAREFYSAISDGMSVDAALSEARKGIFATGNDVEWGTPVLYLRVPDGHLFEIASPPAEETPPTPAVTDSQVGIQVDQLYFQALNSFLIEDYTQAIELFTQVITLRPNYLDAQQKLAEARRKQELPALRQQAESAEQAGKWTVVVAALEKITNLDPEDSGALEALAKARLQAQLASLYANVRQLSQSKKWAAALRAFEQIDALQPGYPDSENLRLAARQALETEEKQKQAEAAYHEGLKLLNERSWALCAEKLRQAQALIPGYRDSARLLEKAEKGLAAERLDAERKAAEAEAQRLAEQAEAQRLAVEAKRLDSERAEAERKAAAEAEAQRQAAEKAEAERKTAEEAEIQRKAVEARRLDSERAEAERKANLAAEVKRSADQRAAAELLKLQKAQAARLAKDKEKAEREAARQAKAGLRGGTALAVDAAGAALPIPGVQPLPAAAPSAQAVITRRWLPYVFVVLTWGIAGYFLNTGTALYTGPGVAAIYGLATGALAGLGLGLALGFNGYKVPLQLAGALVLTWGAAWSLGSFITLDGSYAVSFLSGSKYIALALLDPLIFGMLPGLATGRLVQRFNPNLSLSRRADTWIGLGWLLAAVLGGMKYLGDLFQGYQEGDYSYFSGFADAIVVGVLGLIATRAVLARAGQQESGWKRPDFERWLLAVGTGLLWLGFQPIKAALSIDSSSLPDGMYLVLGLAFGLLLGLALLLAGYLKSPTQPLILGGIWGAAWLVTSWLVFGSSSGYSWLTFTTYGLAILLIVGGLGSAIVLKFAQPSLSGGAFLRILLAWLGVLVITLVFAGLLYQAASFQHSYGVSLGGIHAVAGALSGWLAGGWLFAVLRKDLPDVQPRPLPAWMESRAALAEALPDIPALPVKVTVTSPALSSAGRSVKGLLSRSGVVAALLAAAIGMGAAWAGQVYFFDNASDYYYWTKSLPLGAATGVAAGLGTTLALLSLGLRLQARDWIISLAAWVIPHIISNAGIAYFLNNDVSETVLTWSLFITFLLLLFVPGYLALISVLRRNGRSRSQAFIASAGWPAGLVAACFLAYFVGMSTGNVSLIQSTGLLIGCVGAAWLSRFMKKPVEQE